MTSRLFAETGSIRIYDPTLDCATTTVEIVLQQGEERAIYEVLISADLAGLDVMTAAAEELYETIGEMRPDGRRYFYFGFRTDDGLCEEPIGTGFDWLKDMIISMRIVQQDKSRRGKYS